MRGPGGERQREPLSLVKVDTREMVNKHLLLRVVG